MQNAVALESEVKIINEELDKLSETGALFTNAVTAEWLREFMGKNEINIPQYKIISDAEFPEAFK